MEADELLALRLERCAEWHAGLRTCERQDLREAAQRLRAISREIDDVVRSSRELQTSTGRESAHRA